ncbi:MAG: transglutaminase family protein [Chloroherpetonaceae bacterium]|nr:transglutaminase family protein [Chthonomonadaceae bacterium]MDW8207351.1 transglutaminase family protein [Chloroherpetonaceae bacterium]
MRLRVYHTTRYLYPQPARESHNELRLMPRSDDDQTCLDFRLSITPQARIFAYDLPSGRVHHFNYRPPHNTLTIQAEALVVTHRSDPFYFLQLTTEDRAFYQLEGVRQRYAEFLAPTPRVPLVEDADRIAAIARRQAGASTASFLISLTRALYRVITYTPGATHVNTSLQQVLEKRQGVCQDFAHLMLAVCRRQGIPARYISGYLYTGQRHEETEAHLTAELPAPLVSGDAMHAWVECLMPDERWCGFDPTNNLLANDHYIKVHYGRDYNDVAPVRGVYHGPAEHTLEVSVRVVREA